MTDQFIFEHRYRSHLWRFHVSDYHKSGETLNIWPWYQAQDGTWQPCNPRYGGGGVHIPLERLGELADALMAASEHFASSGP